MDSIASLRLFYATGLQNFKGGNKQKIKSKKIHRGGAEAQYKHFDSIFLPFSIRCGSQYNNVSDWTLEVSSIQSMLLFEEV